MVALTADSLILSLTAKDFSYSFFDSLSLLSVIVPSLTPLSAIMLSLTASYQHYSEAVDINTAAGEPNAIICSVPQFSDY